MTILTLVAYYAPGYKSGGPVQSLAGLVERLGDELRFAIATSDRDCGDTRPYRGIRRGVWQRVGKADVVYLPPAGRRTSGVLRVIREVRPDVLYLNSFFSPAFSIAPMVMRRLRMIPSMPVIVAPRGEFSAGALRLKERKKQAFLRMAGATQLHRGVTWHATSAPEAADIRRCLHMLDPDDTSRVVTAPIVSAGDGRLADQVAQREKLPGRLRVVFLSRIVPKKNLVGALEALRGLRGRVELDIFGPIEDDAYWRRCQAIGRTLGDHVRVRYRGAVEHGRVREVLAGYDLFLLPTLGENFGHVIAEALAAGCPLLLSDQTPWRDLESKGVGWDLPLARPEAFRTALQQCIDMDSDTYAGWSERARALAATLANDDGAVEANRALFLGAGQRLSAGGGNHAAVARSAA